MIIFQSFENFCGFLFFAWILINIGAFLWAIAFCKDEETEEAEEDIQAFIDGIEAAIDNGWDFPEEDFEEYKRLTENENR